MCSQFHCCELVNDISEDHKVSSHTAVVKNSRIKNTFYSILPRRQIGNTTHSAMSAYVQQEEEKSFVFFSASHQIMFT